MNIVNAGSRYQIYGEDVKTYKRLPLMSFEICFNQMAGFYLSSRPDLAVNEEKIYGNHEVKVNKVLNSFKYSDRNFGIILSGQKGIGKSLFARILAHKAIEAGYPILLANNYIPGIADFIASIDQEIVVIFDEFEKNFASNGEGNGGGPTPQEEMLSLFDGLDNGKKLFVITCNEVERLNAYLLNRPGRFHYHFKITFPTEEEIVEYLTDKVKPEYTDKIQSIVNFSRTVNVTYDYLRAIAFELNQGYSVAETLTDLNISQASSVRFNITITTMNGDVYSSYNEVINILSDEKYSRWRDAYNLQNKSMRYRFKNEDIKFEAGGLIVNPNGVDIYVDPDDFWEYDDEPEKKKAMIEQVKRNQKVKSVTITKATSYAEKYLY